MGRRISWPGGRNGVGHAPGRCGICAGAGARGSSRARFNWLIVQEWNCTYIIRCRQTVCMPSMDTDRTPETCSRASIEQSGPPHDIRSEIAYERTGRGTLCGESLAQPRKVRLWVRKLPYIAVLALTILGVAYTSVSRQPLIGYWVFLALATGLLCVTMGWLNNHDSKARFRMVWSQALHWLAFLVAMNIVLLPDVQKMLTSAATGLGLLMLLALGTFVAGVHVSWQICVLGLIMALCVPAIAWLTEFCSLFGLGRRSSYRDWHDLLVAPARGANLETARERRIARLIAISLGWIPSV